MVFQGHAGADGAAVLRQLVLRYSGAVYRYLVGALRDSDAAADLAQEFAVRFIRGDFRRASPDRGRFRNYLKSALINLVNDYHTEPSGPAAAAVTGTPPSRPPRRPRTATPTSCRAGGAELLDRTWKALAAANADYHAVLLLAHRPAGNGLRPDGGGNCPPGSAGPSRGVGPQGGAARP